MAPRAIGFHDGFNASIVGENAIVTVGWSAIQNRLDIVITSAYSHQYKYKNQVFFHVLIIRSARIEPFADNRFLAIIQSIAILWHR